MRLIFATNNQHKAQEIQAAIGDNFELVTLKNAGIDIDIPEPHDTLQANASEKSWTIYKLTGTNCFSEDTGLEVDALNGAPGVKSARYAGESRSFDKNIERLLFELGDKKNRNARFKTVISLIIGGQEFFFEGICEGKIEKKPRGSGGFGYDPVFSPINSSRTFAEMSITEKGLFSHRKRASVQMVAFLLKQAGKIY